MTVPSSFINLQTFSNSPAALWGCPILVWPGNVLAMFMQLVSGGNRIQNPDSLGSSACVLSCWAKLYQPFKPYSFIDLSSKCAIPHPKRESSIDLSRAEATYADQRWWQLTRGIDNSMKKSLFFVQSSFFRELFCLWPIYEWASLVTQMVKNLTAMKETWVRFPDWEDPLEKEMATHFSIFAWRIPWTRGSWETAVHGVAKSLTQLSNQHFSHFHQWITAFVNRCYMF